MKFGWSIVLLLSVISAVASPIFFGHALVEHESKFFGLSALCLAIAALLFFVQKRFRVDDVHAHH